MQSMALNHISDITLQYASKKRQQKYGKGTVKVTVLLFQYRSCTLRVPFRYPPSTFHVPFRYPPSTVPILSRTVQILIKYR